MREWLKILVQLALPSVTFAQLTCELRKKNPELKAKIKASQKLHIRRWM
jgi:hypothetical protein